MSNLNDLKIIDPNLDLFIYDLREGLGQTEEDISKNRRQFWQKIYPKLDDAKLAEIMSGLAEKEQSDRDFVRLLKPSLQKFKPGIQGYYYAALINDFYALQIDCYFEETGQNRLIKKFDAFATLKSAVESQFGKHLFHQSLDTNQGTLGQTNFLWGQLDRPNLLPKDIKEAAEIGYKNYTKNGNWQRDRTDELGQFLGGTLFEVWKSPPGWEKPSDFPQGNHIVMLLFPAEVDVKSQEIQDKIALVYFHFLYLFGYRSKIIWAYHQSRQPASQLKEYFQEIDDLIKQVGALGDRLNPNDTDLEKLSNTLRRTLTILSDYAVKLSELELQNRTLQTNLGNYRKRLEKLKQLDTQSNLKLWDNFADFAQQKYQEQIEVDIANRQPGLTLLENLIRTIEGTIDIYKTAGERRLNLTVASVGTGLAASSVVIGAIATKPPPNKPLFFNKPHLSLIAISLACGIAIGLLTWWVLKSVRSTKS